MNVLDLHAKTVQLVKTFPEVTNVIVNPDLQAKTAEKVNITKMVLYCSRTLCYEPLLLSHYYHHYNNSNYYYYYSRFY